MNSSDVPADVLMIGRPGVATLAFGRPDDASDGSGSRIPIRLTADTAMASTWIEVESWNGGKARLAAYFAELAEAWRGWTGVKDWNDDGASVSMSASHDGIGMVSLAVSLTPHSGLLWVGSWELRVVVPLEPGSLDSVADQVKALLEASG